MGSDGEVWRSWRYGVGEKVWSGVRGRKQGRTAAVGDVLDVGHAEVAGMAVFYDKGSVSRCMITVSGF